MNPVIFRQQLAVIKQNPDVQKLKSLSEDLKAVCNSLDPSDWKLAHDLLTEYEEVEELMKEKNDRL